VWPSGTLNSGNGFPTRWIFTFAPLRNGHRARERFGKLAKNLGHLFGSLKIKLIGSELHPLAVAHGLAGLNAHEDFLSMGVGAREVVTIVGGDEGNAGFA